MIQFRNSFFETNSSSANVLCIPKDQGIHIPKRFIYMDDETSLRPSELVLWHILHGWRVNEKEETEKIVNFLYLNGVEEIIYGGHGFYFEDAIKKYKDRSIDMGLPNDWTKDLLLRALFGNETDCQYYSEGEDYKHQTDYSEEDNDYLMYSAD